jgi:hypothetical protein
MEPISASIVTALASGALAATKDVASTAVKDAYQGLRRLVVERYKRAEPFITAVESNPESEPEQKVLANQLKNADSDPDLKTTAAKLLQALEDLQHDPKAQAILDFKKLRAAKNFELSDVEFTGTLLRAEDATFEGDFKATSLRQGGPRKTSGN